MTKSSSLSVAISRCRMQVDCEKIRENLHLVQRTAPGARVGAAVKADAYGVRMEPVVRTLMKEGVQDFFVATVQEAINLKQIAPDAPIHVLNGAMGDEIPVLNELNAVPVLNTPEQVQAWRAHGTGPCHVMIDTGINRQGIMPDDLGTVDWSGIEVDMVLSHLACADEPSHSLNQKQLDLFNELRGLVPGKRYSFANSGGIMLGTDYHFDMVRPGLVLYGGEPNPSMPVGVAQPVTTQVQVSQIKTIQPGQSVGYGATWTADALTRIATLSIGYADGVLRAFSNIGQVYFGSGMAPMRGLTSMDLITVDVTELPDVKVGDWATLLGESQPLVKVAIQTGLSQYELLTTLGARFDRTHVDSDQG